MLDSPLKFSHQLLKYYINEGDTVVDATVGNGKDTVKLAALVGKIGRVYGFDIQKPALEKTKEKLLLTGSLEQVQLNLLGHEKMNEVITEKNSIAAIVFNLGYLPKGDKNLITKPDTTLSALEQSLNLVKPGGLILVMVYYGHEGGEEEMDSVLSFTKNLDQKEYEVLQYKFINQKNNPPFLLAIEKK